MDTEIQTEWIRRLRSGQYKQGQQLLCRVLDGGAKEYCCWGVLCEMAVEAGVVTAELDNDALRYAEAGSQPIVGLMDGRRMPSAAVLNWAGVPRPSGAHSAFPAGEFAMLAHLNDTGTPFAEIADTIERAEHVDVLG